MYKGWITFIDEKVKQKVLDLGIKLGSYDEKNETYEDCEVTIQQLIELDKYWFVGCVWSLCWEE